jgi:septal ring factor EnvC (AmiA/AmiB activator)
MLSSSRSRPGPGRALTALALVPAPLRRRRLLLRWLLSIVLTAASACAATALLLHPQGLLAWLTAARVTTLTTPTAQPAEAADRQSLQQQVEQLRAALGVAQAHGAELERQIDTLTQRARQCQEELVFFRQSGRRTP